MPGSATRQQGRRRGGLRSRRALLLSTLVVGAGLYAALDGEIGVRPWLEQRAELRRTEHRVRALRHEIERLGGVARGLERGVEVDRFAWERAVREELHFARPGETLVPLPGPDDLGSPAR